MRILGEKYFARKEADAAFLSFVNSADFRIQKLEGDYNATHICWRDGAELNSSTFVLPVKFIKEPAKQFFWVQFFTGIFICWEEEAGNAIIFHSSITPKKRTSRNSLLKKYGQVTCDFQNVREELIYHFDTNCKMYMDVLKDLKHRETTREERLERYIINDLIIEKTSLNELKSILGDSLDATPEKCLADCAFSPSQNELALPIQLKNSSNSLFCSTAGYDSMLLVCRSGKYKELGWLCIPGAGMPNNIELRPKGKYGPYLVKSDEMQQFLEGLHSAIEEGLTTHIWPSGQSSNISAIQLQPFTQLCIPHSNTDRVEYEARTWRQTILPQLTFQDPPLQGLPYDVVFETIRIQDKTSRADGISGRYPVNIHKNAGLTRGKASFSPYARDDFDALCILCHDRKYIFLIPMSVLCERGYASSQGKKGKCAIHCYSMDYKLMPTGRRPKLWTQEYCYRASDPKLQEKFRCALRTCVTKN